MELPWCFHRTSTCFHGITVVSQLMEPPWAFHGNTMGRPWRSHGTSILLPWDYSCVPWDAHGTSMGMEWEFHWTCLRFPWGFHSAFMGFCCYYATPMGLLWKKYIYTPGTEYRLPGIHISPWDFYSPPWDSHEPPTMLRSKA